MNFIPLTHTLSALSVSVMGYNYNLLTSVYLSSNSLSFPVLTSINIHTNLRRVSAICPPFSGYKINSYDVIDKNRITVSIDDTMFDGTSGLIDIIFANNAGYSKLSDKNYLIRYLSGGIPYKIVTINDEDIITIDNSYLVYIH